MIIFSDKVIDMTFQRSFLWIVITLISVILSACGGSSSGGGAPSGTVVPQSAAKAIIAAFEGLDVGKRIDPVSAGKHFSAPGEKNTAQMSDTERIQQALAGLKNRLRKKNVHAIKEVIEPCDSGNVLIITHDKDTLALTDDDVSSQYNDCVKTEGQFRTLTQGTRVSKTSETEFSVSETNLLSRKTNIRTNTFEESLSNGSTTVFERPQDVSVCGELFFSKNMRVTSNRSIAHKAELNGTGDLERDELFKQTNFVLDVSESHTAAPDCKLTSIVFTLNGSMAKSDTLRPSDDYNLGFKNVVMTLKPDSKFLSGFLSPVSGTSLSLSGSVAISSPCSLGIFNINTPSEDPLFFSQGKNCAILGRFIVTTDSGVHAVIATATGGIQIDEGNNGTIEQVFAECSQARTCTKEGF